MTRRSVAGEYGEIRGWQEKRKGRECEDLAREEQADGSPETRCSGVFTKSAALSR